MNRRVLFEVIDGVGWVTLNRHRAMNAVDAPMARCLLDVWTRVALDTALTGVVVVGAGVEAFSVGLDRSVEAEPAPPTAFQLPRPSVPLVVAVNGLACAEAMELVRDADVVVAADHARLSGSRPGRMCHLSGISAREAQSRGLVSDVVPLRELRMEALRHLRALTHPVVASA